MCEPSSLKAPIAGRPESGSVGPEAALRLGSQAIVGSSRKAGYGDPGGYR